MQNHEMENNIERSDEAKAALATMQEKIQGKKGRMLWKSFEELADTPEFQTWVEDEFPNRTSLLNVDRRSFLKISGAALAMAGLSGCRILPQEKAVPYVRSPEELISGLPLTYTTTVARQGYGVGVLVESNEGRPTKVEGNPQHPASLGSTLAQEQAEILTMYDPDRSESIASRLSPGETNPVREETSLDNALNTLRRALIDRAVAGGAGLVLLTETLTSPTLIAQIQSLLQKYPQARWVQYDPLNRENVHEGTRLVFGRPLNPVYRLRDARVIVSLDGNFLNDMPGSIRYARDFSETRRVRKARPTMSRLYAVESSYTIVGATADHRLPVKPSQMEAIARFIYNGVTGGTAENPSGAGIDGKWLAEMVQDLRNAPGGAVVIPGEQTSPAVQALCHAANAALNAIGSTVVYTDPVETGAVNQTATMKALVDDMNAGRVQNLLILGGNPVYNAPADLKFAEALRKVPLVVRFGMYEDETSELAHWHLPMAHTFEAWGDLRAFDGTASLVQPLIAPLHGGRSMIEFLADLNGQSRPGYEILRDYWRERATTANFETWWERVLNEGTVPNTALAAVPVTPVAGFEGSLPAAMPGANLELNLRPDPSLWDGRYANNSWLQECPKPITTITWDNVAIVSPDTAKELGIIANTNENDAVNVAQANGKRLVKLTANGTDLLLPIWILPGQPDGVVTAHLGFGRTSAGNVGTGVGQNTYLFRTTTATDYMPVQVTVTNEQYPVSYTQPHHTMRGINEDRNRDVVRWARLDEYVAKNGEVFPHLHVPHLPEATAFAEKKEAEGGSHGGEHGDEHGEGEHGAAHPGEFVAGRGGAQPKGYTNDQGEEVVADYYRRQWSYSEKPLSNKDGWPSLYPEYSNKGFNAWAMVIDLSTCIGCNACIIACHAENNIPTVGKEQVGNGREMHWLRIDHYFESEQNWENPISHFQPVMCVHCEKAPCEPVCPVAATVHSHEGLNQMIYNRCIGTRYCSNNCPYKVRRFNYLNWTSGVGGNGRTVNYSLPVLKMLANPEVTVRGRGVMEKCTYCVQRINRVRVEAKKAGREIADGEVVTACQQACPTRTIIFGDLNNPNSQVNQLRREPADYPLLGDLNTRPRTTHLARLRNPNPAIEPLSASTEGRAKPEERTAEPQTEGTGGANAVPAH